MLFGHTRGATQLLSALKPANNHCHWILTLGCIRLMWENALLVDLSTTNTAPLTQLLHIGKKCCSPTELNFSSKWNSTCPLRHFQQGWSQQHDIWRHSCRRLVMHHISKYFEKGSEDLDHCLDTVYLICSISPLWKSKEQTVFRMSMLCITAIVMLTYPASGLWGLLRIRCTRMKRMIPWDIPGILDFPGRWDYFWPICQFFSVCLQVARNAGADISPPKQTHVLLTSRSLASRCGQITLWRFINTLSGWRGQLETWLAFGGKFLAWHHSLASDLQQKSTSVSQVSCKLWLMCERYNLKRLSNELKWTLLSQVRVKFARIQFSQER